MPTLSSIKLRSLLIDRKPKIEAGARHLNQIALVANYIRL